MTDVLAVLAEPHRRRILDALRRGECSVGDLVAELDSSQPLVSKHLRVLREAGLAEARVAGQRRLYRLRPEPLAELDAWLEPYRQMWRNSLDRIEIEHWQAGAALTHHFDGQPLGSLPGTVLECRPPHRLAFTWGEDTIGFELSAVEGGTRFVLTEELGAAAAARNAAGWEVCLERLLTGMASSDWAARFEHYRASFEPVLGAQQGPPAGVHG